MRTNIGRSDGAEAFDLLYAVKLIGSLNDFSSKVVSLITDFFHLYLHFSLDPVLLSYLFLSDGYHILTQFISLLKINNELVLPSNDLLVLFNLFLEHHDFFELGVSHLAQEIV